jgi:hypothetical protein
MNSANPRAGDSGIAYRQGRCGEKCLVKVFRQRPRSASAFDLVWKSVNSFVSVLRQNREFWGLLRLTTGTHVCWPMRGARNDLSFNLSGNAGKIAFSR